MVLIDHWLCTYREMTSLVFNLYGKAHWGERFILFEWMILMIITMTMMGRKTMNELGIIDEWAQMKKYIDCTTAAQCQTTCILAR